MVHLLPRFNRRLMGCYAALHMSSPCASVPLLTIADTARRVVSEAEPFPFPVADGLSFGGIVSRLAVLCLHCTTIDATPVLQYVLELLCIGASACHQLPVTVTCH